VLAVDPYSFLASSNGSQNPGAAHEPSRGTDAVATGAVAQDATANNAIARNVRVVRRGDSLITILER
jgi:hypothetical protein